MERGRLQWKTFDTIGPWVLCAASWRCSTLCIVGNISSKHRSGSIAPKLKLLPISRNATPRVQVTQPSSAQLPARMTRDGRRLLKNRDRALDEGAAPWARVAARCSNVPSIHPASIHLAIHLAIKSYLVAGEHYRLSPHGSNPRYFFSASFAWNVQRQAMAARSGTRA